ncbi:putative ABC transporter [Nadsonia fulvescens var. elongata DSM 6958]|uniref:Putative ABC transporter n=1 Tax=Nadsonia fulvescens var. elongata DSM 6958 TaxID=857566 RepID=A0A1E3PG84_9ASCO|nr:putative ABC transporter [Nadsonia fulvescens var. elongata DSM 6958]
MNINQTITDHSAASLTHRRPSIVHSLYNTDDDISISQAQHEFDVISRHLSLISHRDNSALDSDSYTDNDDDNDDDNTNTNNTHHNTDHHEGPNDPFNLETYLRSSRKQEAQHGLKIKQIGVCWKNLTVRGRGGSKAHVRTFPYALAGTIDPRFLLRAVLPALDTSASALNRALARAGIVHPSNNQINILSNFSGLLRPGEMCLVLGKPGSGCTTFLKTMANNRHGYSSVDGSVRYGHFDSATFEHRFRGEAVYNQEDDVHHPTLTVEQTLGFALDTKTPAKRLPGVSRHEFKQTIIHMLLKMFNMEHTAKTKVGNAFIRGVSGGERKRVSIAEMMITGAAVLCYDNTTRGLDASTSLDYAKSIHILTNIYKTTTFVSLYQASERIYEQFDKVMVLDEGRCIYFGPAGQTARNYFISLGFQDKQRQVTPDFLVGCTEKHERIISPVMAATVPTTPGDFERAYRNSAIHRAVLDDLLAYEAELAADEITNVDFLDAVNDAKHNIVRSKSVFQVPFYRQVIALFRRQMIIRWSNKLDIAVDYANKIIIAIVMGFLYLNLPNTAAGAYTRTGVLFMSTLFISFSAFSELPTTMLGRAIVNKHEAFAFHRRSALWVAQIAVDGIFVIGQIICYSLIVYFLTGLKREPGPFFLFVAILFMAYLSMTLFFRTVGCICPNFDFALKFANVLLTVFVIESGYMLGYQNQKGWIRWATWIDPFLYSFSTLTLNEFKGLELKCLSNQLIPFGPSYTDLAYQTCSLIGARPGENIVTGENYIKLTYSFLTSEFWRNFGINIAFCVGLFAINVVSSEIFKYGQGGKTITVYTRESAELKQLNEKLWQKRMAKVNTPIKSEKDSFDSVESSSNIAKNETTVFRSEKVFTWENLNYDVPVPAPENTRRLLNGVFGYVRPGQLVALMGASGAGKTTLLDVLALRKNIGVISGDVFIDGLPLGTDFQRGTSYAEQQDTHEPRASVREALRFSACLRQPFTVPESEKFAYVEEIISLLELEPVADAIIGDSDTGLSVEERKRVTIGVELAAKPELLLFLDEPTSGLDSQSAFNIVRFLRKLADNGQAVICTIHQPTATLFELFDRLLLVKRGGRCVYFGDIGQDCQHLRAYFVEYGVSCPPNVNTAEFMLEAIGAGTAPQIGPTDWADIWAESPQFATVKQEIRKIIRERTEATHSPVPADHNNNIIITGSTASYSTPFWYQLRLVCHRANVVLWRDADYGSTRFVNHIVIGLISGLAYIHLDNSKAALQYRIYAIFQCTVFPALVLAQLQPKYAANRMIYYREASSKMYSPIVFAVSQMLAEIPYSILCAFGFYVCISYPPGFNWAANRSGYQFFIILVAECFAVTLAQALAALTPSFTVASKINPFLTTIFSLFSGVSIPYPSIISGLKWLYQLNPMTRLIAGMVVTELHELPVHCSEEEFLTFMSPAGQTCGEYAADFLASAGGYLRNPAAEGLCQYCRFKVGDDFLATLDYSWDNRWRDLGILIAFVGSNIVIFLLAARYLNYNKR